MPAYTLPGCPGKSRLLDMRTILRCETLTDINIRGTCLRGWDHRVYEIIEYEIIEYEIIEYEIIEYEIIYNIDTDIYVIYDVSVIYNIYNIR